MRVDPTTGHKICTLCGDPKPPEQFHANKQTPDGRTVWCKACSAKKQKVHHATKPRFPRIKDQCDETWELGPPRCFCGGDMIAEGGGYWRYCSKECKQKEVRACLASMKEQSEELCSTRRSLVLPKAWRV